MTGKSHAVLALAAIALLERELGLLPPAAPVFTLGLGVAAALAAVAGGLAPDLDAPASEGRQALGLAQSQSAWGGAKFVATSLLKGRGLSTSLCRAALTLALWPGLAFYRLTGQFMLKTATGRHRGRTHYALIVGWAVPLVFGLTWQRPLLSLTGWAGLLPWLLAMVTQSLHTLTGWAIPDTGAVMLTALGTAFSLGYLMHLIADALTRQGIPLGPWLGTLHLLPRPLRLVSGTWPEIMVVLAVWLGVLARWGLVTTLLHAVRV